nr:MAG TPA: tail collar fiber protein [Caudoviricetes sp.]
MGILIGVNGNKPTFPYDYYYGIEADTAVKDPAVTRVGRVDLHKTLPIQSLMRRCLLDDEGNVVTYLHANDSTKTSAGAAADLSGAKGQVMVEIPEHYVKFEMDGTIFRCLMSLYALPGFHKVPKMYMSAYEAAIQRSTGKLCSVVNTDADYRGGDNNSAYDGTYRTLCGRPVTNQSLSSFRTAARKRGSNAWNADSYVVDRAIYWLFVVEYANFNWQKAFNAELTSEGFHQGGLGAGVTTLNWGLWSSLNGNNPFVPCGHTNSLGNASGVVAYTVTKEDGSDWKTFDIPSYRGIENPFGHIWSWTDGILFNIQSDADGGKSEVYSAEYNVDKYASSLNDGYKLISELPRKEGYITELAFGENGDITPISIGGSNTTFMCDYFFTNIPGSGSAIRGLLHSAHANSGSNVGFSTPNSTFAPSIAYMTIGSRLCFIRIESSITPL